MNAIMYVELWSEVFKRGDHLTHLGTDGRMILKWILNKLV